MRIRVVYVVKTAWLRGGRGASVLLLLVALLHAADARGAPVVERGSRSPVARDGALGTELWSALYEAGVGEFADTPVVFDFGVASNDELFDRSREPEFLITPSHVAFTGEASAEPAIPLRFVSAGAADAGPPLGAVPEPTVWLLMLLGLPAVFRRRARRYCG